MAKKEKNAFDLETALLECPNITWDIVAEILAGNVKSKDDIKKLLESDYEPKNYSYIKKYDRYVVYKTIDGKLRNFGRYKYEEDAKLVSDELKKIDWDYNKLPEEYKKLRCVR